MEHLLLLAMVAKPRPTASAPLRILLMPFETPRSISDRTGKGAPAYWAEWSAYAAGLAKAGILEGGNALEPARTGRHFVQTGKAVATKSGGFATGPAQLSSYFILNVRDLATAEAWARKCPAVLHGGAVELRPMMPKMEAKP